MTFRPMRANEAGSLDSVILPVFGSVKLDGIRCLIVEDFPMSRELKPIPNASVCSVLSGKGYEYFDGELVVEGELDKSFNLTTSGVMSRDGNPNFVFWVFDTFDPEWKDKPYRDRYEYLKSRFNTDTNLKFNPRVKLLPQFIITDLEELKNFEEACVSFGHEGMMVRNPNGKYKFGQSTLKEGWLLKVKRFRDTEGTIIGFEEQTKNLNETKVSNLGYKSRSTSKAGKVGAGTMGKMFLSGVKEFPDQVIVLGTGFTAKERQDFWDNQNLYLGVQVKFKYQEVGTMDKPRFLSYLGIRKD